MRPIIKLIKPDYSEILLYSSIGFGLLILSNFQRFWDYLSSDTELDVAIGYSDIANELQSRIYDFEASIDPRLADFTAWLIIGIIAVIIISVSQKVLEDGSVDIAHVKKLKNTKHAKVTRNDALARWGLRIAGVLLAILWFRLFFQEVYVVLSKMFFDAATNILNPASIIIMIYAIFLMGFAIYFFAICARLIALRIRVSHK